MAKAKEENKEGVIVPGDGVVIYNEKQVSSEEMLKKFQAAGRGEEITTNFWTPEVGESAYALVKGWRTVRKLESKTGETTEAVELQLVESGDTVICGDVVVVSTLSKENVARKAGLTIEEIERGAKFNIPIEIICEEMTGKPGRQYKNIRIFFIPIQ